MRYNEQKTLHHCMSHKYRILQFKFAIDRQIQMMSIIQIFLKTCPILTAFLYETTCPSLVSVNTAVSGVWKSNGNVNA